MQIVNGRSCDGMRFRIRWKIDAVFNEAKPSWIECRSFTNAKSCTIAWINTIRYLCCTTSRMLTKFKLNRIDRNLIPWMSLILFFFFLLAKYSQCPSTRNTYFIHKIILVHDKIAQIQLLRIHIAHTYFATDAKFKAIGPRSTAFLHTIFV